MIYGIGEVVMVVLVVLVMVVLVVGGGGWWYVLIVVTKFITLTPHERHGINTNKGIAISTMEQIKTALDALF